MTTKRILVVDDEPQILRILRRSLTGHEYEVHVASDGATALDTFEAFPPDLVITDLQMPGVEGIELCRSIREVSDVPIVVLSVKGDESTKVAALDVGADDYITKPFGIEELLARVRAALRRSSTTTNEEDTIESGDFVVDFEAHSVIARGRQVHLTPKEFDLLVFFLRNEGKVVTHRKILSSVWGPNAIEQAEYLRVFVGNLRKKFEQGKAERRYIITEPWVGYRFVSNGKSISTGKL
jgi:two-component system KDP operon response regulator KdpE